MILTRSLFVLWLPGVLLLLLVAPRGGANSLRQSCWRAGRVIGVAVACCAPWWLHNIIVLDRFMPLGTQGPITLIGGYCDEALAAGGDWQFEPEQRLRQRLENEPSFLAARDDTAREVLVADAAKEQLWTWIGAHSEQLLPLVGRRIATHWNPYTGRSLLWKFFMLAGAIWLVSRGRHSLLLRNASWWLLGLPLISTCLAAMLYTTGGRFLVPLYGVLFTISGHGVAACVVWGMAVLTRKGVK